MKTKNMQQKSLIFFLRAYNAEFLSFYSGNSTIFLVSFSYLVDSAHSNETHVLVSEHFKNIDNAEYRDFLYE